MSLRRAAYPELGLPGTHGNMVHANENEIFKSDRAGTSADSPATVRLVLEPLALSLLFPEFRLVTDVKWRKGRSP